MKLSRVGLRKLIESVVNEQQSFNPKYTEDDAMIVGELQSALTSQSLGLIGIQKEFIDLRNAYRKADSQKTSAQRDYLNPRSEVSLKPIEIFKKMEEAEDEYDAQAKEVEKLYKNNSESDLFKDDRGNKIEFNYHGNLTAFKYFGSKDDSSAFKKYGDPTTAKTHVEQVFKNCDDFENHYSKFIP